MVTSSFVRGPKLGVKAKLLVDTGASYTILSQQVIESVGISVVQVQDYRWIVTGSRAERLPRVRLDRFHARFASAVS